MLWGPRMARLLMMRLLIWVLSFSLSSLRGGAEEEEEDLPDWPDVYDHGAMPLRPLVAGRATLGGLLRFL